MHQQQQSLKGDSTGAELDVITRKKQNNSQYHRGRRDSPQTKNTNQPRHPDTRTRDKCGRCGREKHPRDKCPAREAQCNNCKRKGHYSAMCYQRDISTVSEEPTEEQCTDEPTDTAFLDTLTDNDTKDSPSMGNNYHLSWTQVQKSLPFQRTPGKS